jgi:hypothetical protein
MQRRNPHSLTSTSDSGSGSLREAINQANTDAGDTIQFNIAGSGPFTITLASQLPTITSKMSIVGGKSLEAGILISGNGSSRIMQISPRGTMTLQYLTFEDARSNGAGGAIFNSGNLTIRTAHSRIIPLRAAIFSRMQLEAPSTPNFQAL